MLVYGKRSGVKSKGAVYKSYVWPTILYGSEAGCLRRTGKRQVEEEGMMVGLCQEDALC